MDIIADFNSTFTHTLSGQRLTKRGWRTIVKDFETNLDGREWIKKNHLNKNKCRLVYVHVTNFGSKYKFK